MSRSAVLDSYGAVIASHPPLSHAEEREVATAARAGDADARWRLVATNMRLAIHFARRQAQGAVELEDLVQEGLLGLMRAVETFDPARGVRFTTYAQWWLRAFMRRHLEGAHSDVHRPSGTIAPPDFSLDTPLNDEMEATHLDLLESEEPGPQERMEGADLAQRVRAGVTKARSRLGVVGWDVTWNRLAASDPDPFHAIGARHGVSKQRVEQVQKKAAGVLCVHLAHLKDEIGRGVFAVKPPPPPAAGNCRVDGCGAELARSNTRGLCRKCQRKARLRPATVTSIVRPPPQPRHLCDLSTLTDTDILDAVAEARRRGLDLTETEAA